MVVNKLVAEERRPLNSDAEQGGGDADAVPEEEPMSTGGIVLAGIGGILGAAFVLFLLAGAISGVWSAWRLNNPPGPEASPIYTPAITWWPQQGRDVYGQRYWPGFEGATSGEDLSTGCPFDTITAGWGTIAGLVSDSAGGVYFGDLGTAGVGSNIWKITTGCVKQWYQPLLTLQQATVRYGGDAGSTYPYPQVAGDMTIVTTINGSEGVVFTDVGTWRNYTNAYCGTVLTGTCGVKAYEVSPIDGHAIARSHFAVGTSNTSAAMSSQVMTSGLNVYGSTVFGGMNSLQALNLGTAISPDYTVENFNGFTFVTDATYLASVMLNEQATTSGAYYGGAIMGGNTPMDDRFNIYSASAGLFNWTASELACMSSAGGSVATCAPAAQYANSIIVQNLNSKLASSSTMTQTPLMVRTPEGINAWNVDCTLHASGAGNCPTNATTGYAIYANLMIVEKRQLLLAKSSSGALYAYNLETMELVGKAYLGPGSQIMDTNAMATDGNYAYINIPNPNKISYITTGLEKRCDGARVKVSLLNDASFMKVVARLPNPCSRASALCPGIAADTFLLNAGIFTEAQLTYADLTTTPSSGLTVTPCGTSVADPRDADTYAMSVGGPVATDAHIYTNAMDGYVYAFRSSDLSYVSRSTRCPHGTPVGAVSLVAPGVLATSCGGIIPIVPTAIADTNVMMVYIK